MTNLKRVMSISLAVVLFFSNVSVFAIEKQSNTMDSEEIDYNNENIGDYGEEEYIEVLDVDTHKIYDAYNEQYRIILQINNEGYLHYVYKYEKDDEKYHSGEGQTEFSAYDITNEEMYNLAQDILSHKIIELDNETNEIYFIEGSSPERASLSRAIGYMRDLSDYRAPVHGKFLGGITRQGVTANVREYITFNAWQVGYLNYNAGRLLIDIALNLKVGIGTILDVVSHSNGLVASISGRVGHYRGENISTKIVNLTNITGTWYSAGIDTNFKVTIGNKSFSAETSYHRAHPDYWNSYHYFANKGLDNYFNR